MSSGGVDTHVQEDYLKMSGGLYWSEGWVVYSKGLSRILQGSMDAALTPSPEIIEFLNSYAPNALFPEVCGHYRAFALLLQTVFR